MVEVALWKKYRKNRDPETRSRLLNAHLGLVHHVARRLQQRLTSQIDYGELLGSGTMGLMVAVERFDPDRGTAFSTFAVPRIQGAILDDLRKGDVVPRSVRQQGRKLRQAEDALRQNLGREPTPAETAEALGIEITQLWVWRDKVARTPSQISLDQAAHPHGEGGASPVGETTIVCDEPLVEEEVERKQLVGRLSEAVAELDERERIILTLYYHEGLRLRQIAEVLGVTESRVSQIRSGALKSLRRRLAHLFDRSPDLSEPNATLARERIA